MEQVFTNIYNSNHWGIEQNESRSGMGSTQQYTENIQEELINFIEEEDIKVMFDTSCGDWNWMKNIRGQLCSYLGVDIVKNIIETNKQLYSTEHIKFIHGDFLSHLKSLDDNSIDLILCRHTLEHLPSDYIKEFFNQCKRVTKYLLVTTYKTYSNMNRDLNFPSQTYRPICLEYEPYKSILEQYWIKSIYDGPDTPIKPEMYINLYKFN
jgi:ubiquinone/menaquinone biosynthesis C-methylase UbiE